MAEDISTVKSSGGDYNSLSLFEDGEDDIDWVTATDTPVAECYDFEDTTIVTFADWTINATYYPIIRGVASDKTSSNTGKWAADRYRLVTQAGNSNNPSIYVDIGYISFQDLQVSSDSGTYQNSGCILVREYGNIIVDSCILVEENSSPGGSYSDGIQVYSSGGSGNLYVFNTVGYGFSASSSAGVYMWDSGWNYYIYSSVFTKSTYGINRSNGTCTAKNCYCGGNGTSDYSGTITMTTCASSDSTGTAGYQSIAHSTANFQNVTDGSEDYHLATSGSALEDAGTDTSGDGAPLNFTIDADGNTRVDTWIGIDEPASGDVTGSHTNLDFTVETPSHTGVVNIIVSHTNLDFQVETPTHTGPVDVVGIHSTLNFQEEIFTHGGVVDVVGEHTNLDMQTEALTHTGVTDVVGIHTNLDFEAEALTHSGNQDVVGDHTNLNLQTEVFSHTGVVDVVGTHTNLDFQFEVLSHAGSVSITGVHNTKDFTLELITQEGVVDITSLHSTLDFQVELFTHLGIVDSDGKNRSVARIYISIGIGV